MHMQYAMLNLICFALLERPCKKASNFCHIQWVPQGNAPRRRYFLVSSCGSLQHHGAFFALFSHILINSILASVLVNKDQIYSFAFWQKGRPPHVICETVTNRMQSPPLRIYKVHTSIVKYAVNLTLKE